MSRIFDNKLLNTVYFGVRLGLLLVIAAVASGCIGAKSKPVATAAVAEPAADTTVTTADTQLDSWTVVVGNHLWGIAANETVYQMPEKWPLLYKRNLHQIQDADLIYPGQVLEVPHDSSASAIEAAVEHARTRGAWAVGPVELSDQQYLKNSP